MTHSNDRLNELDARLSRLEGDFREEAGFLLDGLRALSAQTTNLANRVDELALNAEADRAAIRMIADSVATLAEENRRIWEYLERQQRSQGNGHS